MRRKLLSVIGISIFTVSLLAACGDPVDEEPPPAEEQTPATEEQAPEGEERDQPETGDMESQDEEQPTDKE